MNYNEKHKTISFRTDEFEQKKLERDAKQPNDMGETPSKVSHHIVKEYYKGNLVHAKTDQQKELTQLRIEKIKAEIEYLKIKNNFAINFNQPISRSATVHIKPEIVVETPSSVEPIRSPYDASNKRLQCMECSALICWKNKDEYVEAIGKLETHLMLNHNRRFNVMEKEVIDNLQYEGDSR